MLLVSGIAILFPQPARNNRVGTRNVSFVKPAKKNRGQIDWPRFLRL